MTPGARQALVAAALAVVDVLADYGNDSATTMRDAIRADVEAIDDDTAVRLATHVLDGAARELSTMAQYLAAAVKMGSDHGAAFTAVQADAASAALRAKGARKGHRARDLKAQGMSNPKIAGELGVTVRRVQQLLRD